MPRAIPILLAVCVGSCLAAAAPTAEQIAFFESKVRPVLVEHCYECHSADSKKLKGGLRLDTREAVLAGGDSGEPALIPGDPEQSQIIRAVRHMDPDFKMPPKTRIPDAQIRALEDWVKMGAPDPRDGTPLPARRADKSWWSLQPLANPEPPSPEGLPEAWAANPIDRFVYAGLASVGLKPNPPADRRTFIRRASFDLLGLPPTPEDVERFVALESPDAEEKLIDQLLASPHYGEQWGRHWLDVIRFGESTGFERNVIINNLWPFRDYVIRSFNEDKPFNRLILEHLAGDVVAAGDPATEVATAFLVAGPYDNVGNQDAAAQAQIRAQTLDEIVTTTSAAFLGLTVNCARCHHHKFDPITQEDYFRIQAAFAGVEHGERALSGEAQRRPDAPSQPAKVWAGRFSQPKEPAYLHKGGDPAKRGDIIKPASLSVLANALPAFELPPDAPESERRLALGKWIADDRNPLTARVLANRIWHYHFGVGLVDTPSDFGFLGGTPTHPELLDWLAQRIIAHGWRLKPIHREIMLSQTYRQSAAWRADAANIDKDARLLWRFPPRRLAAEEIRDAILGVAGVLNADMGGPGFRLYRYVEDNVATYVPLDAPGPETFRRAVYHQNARAAVVDLLSDFDAPDPAFPAPNRTRTNTPLQALTLLNHHFTLDLSRHFASRIEREVAPGDNREALIVQRAFVLAYQRPPRPDEHAAALKLIRAHGIPALCRALFNSNEFLYLE